VADRIIFEETDAFMVGSVAYPVPRSLAIRLRRREGETTSWRPELEEALGWVWENRAPNLPVERYARVHMLGRQTHVGEVTDLGGGALLVQAKRFEPTPEPRIIHYAYRSEAAGRYGVEYISDEQWAEYCKSLEFAAQQKQLAEKAKARAPLDPRADPPPGYTINFGPTDDDPDGEDHWTWISEDESSGLFQIRAEAVEDAWLHFVPSEEAPAANSVERLDFSKRPPGYSDRPHCERSGCDANMMDAEAWAHYKAQHDPPSISVVWEPDERWDEKSDGEWHVVTTVTGPTTILWHRTCGFVEKELRKPDVRTLAWASYERSLALAVKLEATTEDSHPLTSYCPPPWPCCLTWTDREVAAVERWLTDRTAEMPEVLRGR
jgi:hypothetical protein